MTPFTRFLLNITAAVLGYVITTLTGVAGLFVCAMWFAMMLIERRRQLKA
jgi:hypothetical protein